MSEIQVMTDSINLDSNDLVGNLEDFESLETFQAELERLGQEKVMIEAATDINMGSVDNDEVIKVECHGEARTMGELAEEDDGGEDEDEEEEEEDEERMEEDEEMEEPMEEEEVEMEYTVIHSTTIKENEQKCKEEQHDIFSDGVATEEIIENEQVIEDGLDGGLEEEIIDDKMYESSVGVMGEVTREETVVSDQVKVEMETEDEEDITDQEVERTVVEHEAESEISNQESSVTHAPPGSVYVVAQSHHPTTASFINAQSLLANNILTQQKDNTQKMTRVYMPSDQTIRILGPQGRFLGSTAKTITLAQAKQMGLFSQANQILPANTTAKVVGTVPGKVVIPKKTVTVVKSPTKILPAPPNISTTGQAPKTKVLIRQGGSLKPGTILASPTGSQVIRIPTSQGIGNIHQIQLPGKQVQYVKLVGGSKPQTTTLVPVSALSKTIPVALSTSLLNSAQGSGGGSGTTTFKVLPIPATAVQTSTQPSVGQTQRVLIPSSQATGQPGVNNIVVVPSHLIHQVKKLKEAVPIVNASSNSSSGVSASSGGQGAAPAAAKPQPPAQLLQSPTAPQVPAAKQNVAEMWGSNSEPDVDPVINTLEANGIRPRKPCNCTKSMCLKLYCDCFANGEFCNQCNCTCCHNNLENEEERQKAIKSCLERNPTAFRPKIGKSFSDERRHNKGCNCRRSGCLKNYCECYEAKIPCSRNCKCVGCKNLEGYTGKRGDGEERSLIRSKMVESPPQQDLTPSNRQAFQLLTTEVVQATCQCLLAQAEDWEKEPRGSLELAQSLVIEEFGRCVVQIIDCVSKTSPHHHLAT